MERRHCFVLAAAPDYHCSRRLHSATHVIIFFIIVIIIFFIILIIIVINSRQLSLRNHQWWHLWGYTVLMYGPIRPLCPNLLCTIFIVIPLYHHHHHHQCANVRSNQVPMASTPIYSARLLSVL